MTDALPAVAKSAVLFGRLLQVTVSILAFVFVAGALLGDMAAFAFLVIGPIAVGLLLAALVIEFVMIRPLQRRSGGENE